MCEKILLNKGNLFLMGIGKSGNIAEKVCSTLSSTGTPAIYINAAEASHGDLGAITKKDILLIFSYSGETDEILKILPACKKKAKDIFRKHLVSFIPIVNDKLELVKIITLEQFLKKIK